MSTLLSLTNHLKVLEERHRSLDKQIIEEYDNFIRDEEVENHKKEKLLLKDEIEALKKIIELKRVQDEGK